MLHCIYCGTGSIWAISSAEPPVPAFRSRESVAKAMQSHPMIKAKTVVCEIEPTYEAEPMQFITDTNQAIDRSIRMAHY